MASTPTAPTASTPAAPAAHGDATSTSSTPSTASSGSGRKSRAGRRPSPVWDFFTPIRTEHNTVHAQCNFCERRCAGVAARMVHHIVSKCPAAPQKAVDALGGEAAIMAAAMKKRKTGEHQAKSKSSATTTQLQPQAHGLVSGASGAPTVVPTTTIGVVSSEPAGAIENLAEQQVASAHQKLVLACILNDIPLQFVEDEALMDAFSALRPGFHRLTAQVAQTTVLEDVLRAVVRTVDESLRGLEQFAIIHRHRQSGDDATQSSDMPDLWLGVDGKSEPLLLAETTSSSSDDEEENGGPSSSSSSLVRLQAETAVLSAQCARLPVTTTLSFCTGHSQLFYHLHRRQHACELSSEERQHQQDDEPMSSPSEDSDDLDSQRLKSLLLGTCLLQQTMLLQKRLLQLVPSIVALLQEATVLVYSLMNHPRVSSAIRSALLDLAHASSTQTAPGSSSADSVTPDQFKWDLPARLVKRLLSLESELRAFWTSEDAQEQSVAAEEQSTPSSSVSAPEAAAAASVLPVHRDSLWDELRQVDALLAPFSWAFALSEADSTSSNGCNGVTSAQYLVLWLWLLSIVSTSASIPADQKDAFTAHTVSVIRRHVADHQLACMLLDPRVHGAGLSATGKRKVKALVVKVAERVFPAAGFHTLGTSARTNLLAHLGHFSDKTAQFADKIAWEMSAGKAAELFWSDYVDDARELARVARAVVKFIPHTQSAASLYGGGPVGKKICQKDGQQEGDSFPIRQIKQLHQKKKASKTATAHHQSAHTVEEIMAQYASILLPIGSGGPSASSTGASAATRGMEESRDAGEAATSRILLAMAQQIQSLLSESSSRGSESSHQHQAAVSPGEEAEQQQPTAESAVRKSSANGQQSAAEKTLSSSPSPSSPQEENAFEIPVEASWFAFGGDSDRKAIESAVKRFVSPSVALVVV